MWWETKLPAQYYHIQTVAGFTRAMFSWPGDSHILEFNSDRQTGIDYDSIYHISLRFTPLYSERSRVRKRARPPQPPALIHKNRILLLKIHIDAKVDQKAPLPRYSLLVY